MIYTDELGPLAGGAEDALPGGLWDAVLRLSKGQRTVVTLYYCEDLSVAEIARVLGVAQGTVESRLDRARRRLEERLQEENKAWTGWMNGQKGGSGGRIVQFRRALTGTWTPF